MNVNNASVSNMVSQSLSRLKLNTLNRSNNVSENNTNSVKISNGDVKNEQEFTLETQESELNASESRKNINVDEIQQYASMMGEKLSIDDINYGLMYGRSVIADFSA